LTFFNQNTIEHFITARTFIQIASFVSKTWCSTCYQRPSMASTTNGCLNIAYSCFIAN